MSDKMTRFIISLLITIPIAFSMIFFGYLHPTFDVIIYTDNIKGEGTCSAYLSSMNETFAYLYQADAYFGSELKTLRMQELRYDVDKVSLFLYGIEEADILAYDIAVYGFTVMHHNSEGDHYCLRPMTKTAITLNESSIAHIVNPNPQETITANFEKSIGIPIWVWIIYVAFISLISILLAIGLDYVLRKHPRLGNPLLHISAILVAIIMGCFFCGSLPYVDYTYFLLNWLLLFSVSIFINALTLPWIGTVFVSFVTLMWYIANYFVIAFRNKPIMPADIKAAGTAAEVVGGYDLTPPPKMIIGMVIVLIYVDLEVVLWRQDKEQYYSEQKKTRIIKRGVYILLAIALVFLGVNNSAFKRLNTFQWDAKVMEGFHREGAILTFVRSAMSGHVKKPEGYSREVVNEYLDEYLSPTQASDSSVHPTRIIMVMNEAFSDLRVVGMDPSIDVMPFIDSLEDNTVKGSLYVSVLGGGTCNTEFEALTGNSLAFMGAGAYPYTENVTEPLFSLASYFGNDGYFTEAFHANEETNWNRNTVYPNLGFTDFTSIEDYSKLSEDDYLHSYVSDRTDYREIEAEDSLHSDSPRFLFGVTIQNHADYDHFGNVEEAETIKQNGSDLEQSARVYLSLIKASDDAIKDLVEKYQNSDEPTMIVFFGDHQPYLGGKAQEQIYANVFSFLDYFRTKFFIWTNYETQSVGNLGISANYLPWLILHQGNFSLPPYVQMLQEVYETYPVITSQGIIDCNGNVYDNIEQLEDDPLIKKYKYIQYANLFDELDPAWFKVQ